MSTEYGLGRLSFRSLLSSYVLLSPSLFDDVVAVRRVKGEGAGRGVFPNQLISSGGTTAAAGYSLISTCYQPPAVGRAIHRRPRPALPSHLTDNVLPTMNTNRSLYIIAAHNAICVDTDRPTYATALHFNRAPC